MTHVTRTASSLPRPVRGAIVVLLVMLLGLLPFGGEARAATKVLADRSAWFWMSNEKITVEDVAGQLAPGASIGGGAYGNTGANPISPGHLGVAMRNGQPDMRSYIHFDTNAIPLGATIESFLAKLTLSQKTAEHSEDHSSARGRTPATLNDANAGVRACIMREPWGDNVANGGGGDPVASTTFEDPTVTPEEPPGSRTTVNEPTADCSISVPGKRTSDGTAFTFELAPIAQTWSSGTQLNEGIAIVPVENGLNPTWILEFHGPKLELDSDAGPVVAVPASLAPFATVKFTGGIAPPPPPPPPPLGPIDSGPVTFPTFGNPTPPENGTTTAPPTTATPTTFTPIAFTSSTPAWFFALFVLGLIMLAWLQRMVGSDPLGLTAAAASNNVANVLHERRLAGGESVGAIDAIKEEEIAELED